MRAFTSKGRRAAPCFDTRPASGCQGSLLSQSFINIRVSKQKRIYPETSRLLLFLNSSHNKTLPIIFTLLCTIQTKERHQLNCVPLSAASRTRALPAPQSMGFPRKNTAVSNHFFLQGMLPAQASILYRFRLVSPA